MEEQEPKPRMFGVKTVAIVLAETEEAAKATLKEFLEERGVKEFSIGDAEEYLPWNTEAES